LTLLSKSSHKGTDIDKTLLKQILIQTKNKKEDPQKPD